VSHVPGTGRASQSTRPARLRVGPTGL
jgi:hypothetical protein